MDIKISYPIRFWLGVLLGIVLLYWLFSPVMFPFAAGITMAYFLEPIVSKLERNKIPRWLGTLITLAGFLFFIVLILLLISPMVIAQITALALALPDYIEKAREHLIPWAKHWISEISPNYAQHIEAAKSSTTENAAAFLSSALKGIVSGGLSLINIITLFILTPVIAFYVLRDWDKMTAIIDNLIPRKSYAIIKEQLSEINKTLSGFIRGQALVCLCLGLFYAIGLRLSGLEYGVTVGLVAGVLTIIPYVGTVFGFALSTLLAVVQFEGDLIRIGIVILVFVIGQGLEGYILTPKLVGDRVGLHPVWILFAIIAGLSLLGFTGALIAVPVAAVIGVLVRFAAKKYKESDIYKRLV